eukprot:scaffold18792_cov135-Isochrysis_galbana.AAC.4
MSGRRAGRQMLWVVFVFEGFHTAYHGARPRLRLTERKELWDPLSPFELVISPHPLLETRLGGATVKASRHLSSDCALRRLAQARATSDERGGTLGSQSSASRGVQCPVQASRPFCPAQARNNSARAWRGHDGAALASAGAHVGECLVVRQVSGVAVD